MKTKLWFFALTFALVFLASCQNNSNVKVNDWAIALHGGAGAMSRENYTEEQITQYETELAAALQIGEDILSNGGSSLDAVEQVVRYLEDCPLFNAGRGAVFTNDGKNELDAAIMEGSNLKAGAVAGVGNIKNPISAARMVMEKSEHVLMVGKGASLFALQNGAEVVDSSYFFTERSYRALQRALERDKKMGTVGCVALDKHGNLAAATSTGGMTNKKYGRVGDVPIIGAGTYANNKTCAISATGHGEYFIRYTVAHDISALMEYKRLSLAQAAEEVIHNKLEEVDGRGGIIAVDKYGNVNLSFNTSGMFRAFATSGGEKGVGIFKD
ncbi:MAG: isoaspartyl peptidase/L-asparaginase [Tenuifilaceae bacterium]|jgi:beta-aspartyl-peptidase (threonine type)|nr:isoaspartyl peptidase/L-asparaginase [Tenuifilaceae bacterium]